MKRLIRLLAVFTGVCSTYSQTVVYENDFETKGTQPNFDTSSATINDVAGRFLGKFSGITRQSATLTLTNLPPHQYVTVSFDLLVAMTWDGNGRGYIDLNNLANYIPSDGPDIFKVTADDRTMIHTTFASHDLEFYRFQSFPGTFPQDTYRPGTGAVCTNCVGAQWDLDWYWLQTTNKPLTDAVLLKDALYHIDITYTNNSDSTVVVFKTFALAATYYQGDYDEWWGLDNVKVQVSDDPITPVTECTPKVVQSIVQSSATAATLYVVGEAGTDLTIQSSVDMLNWVDEKIVNFTGFYKSTVSLKPKPITALSTESTKLRVWRVIQSPKKHL